MASSYLYCILGAFCCNTSGMAPKIPQMAGAELLEADGQAGSGAQQAGDGCAM